MTTMKLKYDIEIEGSTINKSLQRLLNLTYKLLPTREEGKEWQKLLESIIFELNGMKRLFEPNGEDIFFQLILKLEGLFVLTNQQDFYLYRRMVFECITLIDKLRGVVNGEFE